MATLKAFTCRDHGGIFKQPVRRGRQPVKCKPDNKCTRHPDVATVKVSTEAPASKPVLSSKKRDLRTRVQKPAEVTTTVNPSIPPAMAAKALLVEKGWLVEGRAWMDTVGGSPSGLREGGFAEITATRDDERIYMVWVEGELKDQTYSLWHNGHTPEANGRPKSNLGFDPEELTDQELIRVLSGQKVTWWNRLGSNQESGTIANKVQISHTYIGGKADENPGERVITFVDHGGGGFRSFHASALVKVG